MPRIRRKPKSESKAARQIDRVPARLPVKRSDGPPSARKRLLNVFHDAGELVLVHPSEDGARPVLRRKKAEFSSFIKVSDLSTDLKRMLRESPKVRETKLEGDYLRILWRDRDTGISYSKKLEDNGIKTFEAGLNPVLRYMVDHDIEIARPRIAFFDIETDSRIAPVLAKEGVARVLSWGLIGEDGRKFSGMLEEESDKDERRILQEFFEAAENYDLILAWNGDGFDFPIIRERALNLYRLPFEWHRWLWLDQMKLFEKFNMSSAESGDEKQSLKLDSVASSLGLAGKNDFDASKTWEAWEAGGESRQEMHDYMMQDVAIMPGIEHETGFVEMLLTVCEATRSFPDTRGMLPSVQVEGFLQSLAIKRGHKFDSVFRDRKKNESDAYQGAFVLHPTSGGIHKNVHVADFASLYPSIMITWNMSPDTKIDVLDEDFDPAIPVCESRGNLTGSKTKFVHYRTDKVGILPDALKELLKLRKFWNDKKGDLPPGTKPWKDADRRSSAYKIVANSFYGVIGQPTCRFFDREVAESITQSGAWLIQETIRLAELKGMRVIYGDTDSLFVAGATRHEFDEFVKECNVDLYPDGLGDLGCVENLIKLAYEKEFERIIFSCNQKGKVAAKRYAGRYVHYKGTDATIDSKPEIKGLEFKRGDSLRLARQLQEHVVLELLGDVETRGEEDHEVFLEKLAQWKIDIVEKFVHPLEERELGVADVKVTKSLSQPIEDYKSGLKKDGTPKRQPPHVELAKVLRARGEDVGAGTRVSYFIKDGAVSPKDYELAELFGDGSNLDRFAVWEDQVSKPTISILMGAFPGVDWKPSQKARPKKIRKSRSKVTTPAS